MREKLLKLMENRKLTASRLAELLGIRSSGISHILSGRNNPSFDLLQKILRRFPMINPDWLLLESEQMFRPGYTDDGVGDDESLSAEANLFDSGADAEITPSAATQPNDGAQSENLGTASATITRELAQPQNPKRAVRRIIVLYDDNTFESYNPR